MSEERSRPRIPDLLLERYRLNELSREEAERVAEAVRTDADVAERLRAIERSDEAIRGSGAIDTLANRLEGRVPPSRSATTWRWFLPLAASAGVVAAVALATQKPASAPAPLEVASDVTVKGGTPSLAVYRKAANGSETLADGDAARAGDVIRVGYRSAGRPYGIILSIDGRASVTLHLPRTGDRAVALEPAKTVLLDTAYELDDAPRWERFYFVTGDQPFAVAPVVDAARTAADPRARTLTLALSRGLEQTVFSLHKEARP